MHYNISKLQFQYYLVCILQLPAEVLVTVGINRNHASFYIHAVVLISDKAVFFHFVVLVITC